MTAVAHPVAQKHVLVTFGGTFGSGTDAEIWQCGVKMGPTSADKKTAWADNLQDLPAYLNLIKTPLSTWFSAAANNLRGDFRLGWVKVANIKGGPIGKGSPGNTYDGSVDALGHPNPQVATLNATGGSTNPANYAIPQIITMAITWRASTVAKGRPASVGRIYPPSAFTTNSDRAGSAIAAQGVTCGQNLLTALSKDGPLNFGLVTGPIRPILYGIDGTMAVVDQVSCGDVVDTVRRRKDALKEVYTTAAWA